MHFGGYHVGIVVHMVDHVTASMGKINHMMMTGHRHTQQYKNSIHQLESKLIKLHAMQFGGESMFKAGVTAINAMLEPAKEYEFQIQKMNQNLMTHAEMLKHIKTAWSVSLNNPIASATENLQLLMEGRGILGGGAEQLEEMRELLPELRKAQSIFFANTGSMEEAETAAQGLLSAIKTMEMVGVIQDKQQRAHHLDMMQRVFKQTGGLVTPQDFQQTMKYSRQMKTLLGEDFTYKVLPVFIQEMKGKSGSGGAAGGPGTMVAAFGRAFVRGVMNKKTASFLESIGMLEQQGIFTQTTRTLAEVKDANMAANNPQQWIMEKLLPAFIQHNPEFADKSQSVQMLELLKQAKLTETAGSLVSESINKSPLIERFGKLIDASPPIDKAYELSLKSPAVIDKQFEETWTNFLTSLGAALYPVLIPALQATTWALNQLAAFFQANPMAADLTAFAILASTIVGAGLALFAAGTAGVTILATLGISLSAVATATGWVVASVTAITMVLYSLTHWDTVVQNWNYLLGLAKSKLDEIGSVLQEYWTNFIGTYVDPVTNAIGRVGEAMQPFTNALKTMAAVMDPFQQFQTKMDNASHGVGLMRTAAEFALPKIRLNGGANQASNRLISLAEGAIKIVQQPGQNSEEIAKAVFEQLTNLLQEGILTTVQGGGNLFSSSQVTNE